MKENDFIGLEYRLHSGEKHESNHKIRHGRDALIDSARSLRLSLA